MAIQSVIEPRERVDALIRATARAWNVALRSPRALARQAPHGYVPQRVLRRLAQRASADVAQDHCR